MIKLVFLLVVVAGGAWCLTGLMRHYALAKALLAMPNERSAHKSPVPCGGGVVILGVFLLGLAVLVHWGLASLSSAVALAGGGMLVGLIGFIDDCGHVDARWRLLAHFAGAGWVLAWLGGLPPLPLFGVVVDLGWAGDLLAAVYLVWLLNLYNFMDGIDGIASAEALTVSLGGVFCLWLATDGDLVWPAPLLLAAAVLGFLCWNLPPARIFMGDSGSGFLGLVLGAFSLRAGWVAPELFWAWLVLLGVFVVDATFTLLRRIVQGETFYQPHSTHAYQHAARRYGSHGKVSLAVAGINLIWLLPWAVLVALGRLDGLSAVLIAYAPLVGLAFHFDAGLKIARKPVAFAP